MRRGRCRCPASPNFRLPSGSVVNTVFPAATGGRPPYVYSVSGLPPGIAFFPSTRGASGTLPTVWIDTTYGVTYTVTDNAGAGASVAFSATVARTSAPPPPPPPSPTPSPSPTPPVQGTQRLPFTVSETDVSGEQSYRFRLSSGTDVSVSLTGMDRDIDCRVNSSACTNRGGTRADSWSGTLEAGTHTVAVYPYGGGSGSWTLSVGGSTTAPPPPPPPPSPPTRVRRTLETRVGLVFATETASGGGTYSFTLASRQTVHVSLTGMNRDIDCSVNGSRCSNRGGTRDDDWSGELAAGSHSVRVYPYQGGTGNYTIMAIVNCPDGHFASGGSCYRYVVPEVRNPPREALGGAGPEVLSCDGDTELAAGEECVDGVVIFSEEMVVTSTPIPVPPLMRAPLPPPPPLPLHRRRRCRRHRHRHRPGQPH